MLNWLKGILTSNAQWWNSDLEPKDFDDEGSIPKRLVYSLKSEPDNWETHSYPFSSAPHEKIGNVMFQHKEKEIRFNLSYDKIQIRKPVEVSIDRDDSAVMKEYLDDIWSDKGMDENFVIKYIAAKTYYKLKISKEQMKAFDIKLWCYNNLEGQYRIDPCPEPIPPTSYDSEHRAVFRRRNKESGKYDNIICWFEDKADLAQFKLTVL